MEKTKKKNKTAKVIIVITLLFIGIAILSSSDKSNEAEVEEIKIDVMDMTEAFTLDNCDELCDKYDLAIQSSICENNCGMIGKEGSSLDKYCMTLIELFKEE